jgi:hypothetical protein
MSWDVMIFRLRGLPPKRSLEELSEETMLPLGGAVQVREGISAALGGVNWSNPSWGQYAGDGFSIEFNVGHEDPVENMMLHVRGGGDAIGDIMKFVVPNGWVALDCSTSEFFDPANPSNEGWVGFQRYRDQVFKRGEAAAEE